MEFENFYLVAVYVPNAGEGLKRLTYRVEGWDYDFKQYLTGLTKPVILAGDLNVAQNEIDVYDPSGKHKTPGFTPEERNSFS
jgi:exonuclease III